VDLAGKAEGKIDQQTLYRQRVTNVSLFLEEMELILNARIKLQLNQVRNVKRKL
jgi:hypothetical protein